MNKKIMMFFSMLLIAVLLVACESSNKKSDVQQSPYIGGTKGIAATFEPFGVYNEQTKIYEIFEGEAFPIEITIKNKGEQKVEAGVLSANLTGISLAEFSGIVAGGSVTNNESIDEVSDTNKDGGQITLDLTPGTVDAKYLINLSGGTKDLDIYARVSYRYKTRVSVPKVCFKGDPNSKEICNIEETKAAYSSGAPIQAISAEEKSIGTGKFMAEIVIENKGSGEVTKPGTGFSTRYDELTFSVSEPSIWDCKSGGKLNEARLDSDGKATIQCRTKNAVAKDDLYTKELRLDFDYDYRELIHQQLRLKKQ
ncbi:hypothetical protein HYU07_03765 [Candidatus Woesearchaeota archaeon]|nr:hypothetical protein [Candidatus Woesearchaeota archaeon]